MVKHQPPLDRTFAALADPTRRAIVARLARGECTAGELAAPFAVSLPAISRHLRVLERAGLMRRTKQGRVHRCRLEPRAVRDATAWLDRQREIWERRLDRLERLLEQEESE